MRNAITEQTTGLGVAGQVSSQNYWEEYRNFWDKFVGEWLECCKSNKPHGDDNSEYGEIAKAYNDFFKSKDTNAKLNLDELPEPYMGYPKSGVKAVILNLNPGMSQTDEEDESLEWQKFYSLRDKYQSKGPFVRDSLIKDFSDRCHKRYSEFVKSWSCLDPKYRQTDTDLCGVKWWQGVNPASIGGRVKWLARIYGKEPDVATSIHCGEERAEKLNPLEVFALELCPFHSKEMRETDSSMLGKSPLKKFVMEHVIYPAIKAVCENDLPFAVAIGAPYRDFFEESLGIRPDKTWSHDDQIIGWPKKKESGEDVNVNRQYRLYLLKDKDENQARFLVTWSQAPGNNPPGKRFIKIDKLIREYIKDPSKDPLACNKATGGAAQINESPKAQDSSQNVPKTAKTVAKAGKKQQYYQKLWSGFYNWCRGKNKVWCADNIDKNCIFPSGRRGDPYLFFKVAGWKLYLGIYCTVSTHTKIQEICAEEINAAYAGVDWNDGEARKTWRCIPIPIDGDWTNPDDVLFEKMAAAFENVGSILQEHGLRITMLMA